MSINLKLKGDFLKSHFTIYYFINGNSNFVPGVIFLIQAKKLQKNKSGITSSILYGDKEIVIPL